MKSRERDSSAAAILRECRDAFAARGGSPITEATGLAPPDVPEWRHYPTGEVYDPASHAQHFYHRHAPASAGAADGRSEHGHFHLFLRGEGIPAGITPLVLPELAVAKAPRPPSAPLKRGSRDEVCHLVAVAVDWRGEPLRLFTTNRWVTGETWYRAEDVLRLLDRFALRLEHPSALLNRWLAALVRLYHGDIAELLRQRDKAIVEQRWRRRSNALEDPRLEVTSALDIDLDARLAAVERRTLEPAARIRRRPLPRMAEGWGA